MLSIGMEGFGASLYQDMVAKGYHSLALKHPFILANPSPETQLGGLS